MEKKLLSERELVSEWLKYLIKDEQKLIRKYTKSSSDVLYNSFQKSMVEGGDGKVQSAILTYARHLRFLDMGVGRGVPIGSRKVKADFEKYRKRNGQLHKYNRKKVPVYNKPTTAQVKRLLELMLDNLNVGVVQVVDRMSGTVNVKLNG
jgi:hypothetical protein